MEPFVEELVIVERLFGHSFGKDGRLLMFFRFVAFTLE